MSNSNRFLRVRRRVEKDDAQRCTDENESAPALRSPWHAHHCRLPRHRGHLAPYSNPGSWSLSIRMSDAVNESSRVLPRPLQTRFARPMARLVLSEFAAQLRAYEAACRSINIPYQFAARYLVASDVALPKKVAREGWYAGTGPSDGGAAYPPGLQPGGRRADRCGGTDGRADLSESSHHARRRLGAGVGSGHDCANHLQTGERASRRSDRDREQAGCRHDGGVVGGREGATRWLHVAPERAGALGQSKPLQ